MDTQTLAHRFFHEPTARGRYERVNAFFSYYKNDNGICWWDYYSYSTRIATIKKDKKGNNVLVLNSHNYSKTTVKHMYELRHACPFEIVNVPNCEYNSFGFRDRFEYILKWTDIKSLSRKEERDFVTNSLQMFDEYQRVIGGMPKDFVKLRKSAKMRKLEQACQEINEKRANQKQHTEEERAIARAKREAYLVKKLNEFMTGTDELQRLKMAYQHGRYNSVQIANTKIREAVLEYRNMKERAKDSQGRHLSYAWVEGELVKTSQQCDAPIREVRLALYAWKKGKPIIGMKMGGWTVVENTSEFVKIGCHVIPNWNIELLYNKLVA